MTDSSSSGAPGAGEREDDRSPRTGEESPFGEFLTGHRENRQLSLDEAAGAVRIPVRYLEAMEGEDYEVLPPTPYVRGFLDAYARYLGVDRGEMIRRFEAGFREHRRQDREEGRGAIFALFRPRGESLHCRDWAIPLVLAAAVAVFMAGRFILAMNADPEGLPTTYPPRVEAPVEKQPLAVPEGEAVKESPAPGPSPAAVGVRLLLTAEGSTWVSAQRDEGEVEEWTLRGGEARELTAGRQITLSIGNAGAVRITFNERELGFIGLKGQVKRGLLFTAPEE